MCEYKQTKTPQPENDTEPRLGVTETVLNGMKRGKAS